MKLKYQFKGKGWGEWTFWFKFIIGSAIIITILYGWIYGLATLGYDKAAIEKWITQQGRMPTLDEITTEFGKAEFMSWVSFNPTFGVVDNVEQVVGWKVGANFTDYTMNQFSYFTTLSNIGVAIWFLIAAFKPQNEGKIGYLSNSSTIMIVTFITITALVWNSMLLPFELGYKLNSHTLGNSLIRGFLLHLVYPLAMIFYVMFIFVPENMFTAKIYLKNEVWKQIVFLTIYTFIVLVRGELRYQGNKPIDNQYPYFFLQIHNPKVFHLPGLVWFAIVGIVIILSIIGFSALYTTRLSKKENKLKIVQAKKEAKLQANTN